MTEWVLTSSVLILLVLAVRGLFKERMKAKYTYALWLVVLVRLLCPVNFGEVSFNLLSLADRGQEQLEEHLEDHLEERLAAQAEAEAMGVKAEFPAILGGPDGSVAIISLSGNDVELMEPYFTEALPEGSVVEDAGVAADLTENALSIAAVAEPGEAVVEEPEAESVASYISSWLFGINWKTVLCVVWAVGMAVIAIIVFSVNISFGTMLGVFRKELPHFARKGRGNKELAVYLADGIHSSCLFGVLRPSIYLNKKEMGEQEKTYCVEHEYSHYLQGDMVWSFCRTLCLILHWYNPLVWLAVALSQKDAELACDERTIERLGEEERYHYGHTLVELAAGQSKTLQVFGMATLMSPDKKEVVDRVKAITTRKETKILTALLVAILLVGISFFVFTGEAKGEQENNNNAVTETPAPTKAVAAETAALEAEKKAENDVVAVEKAGTETGSEDAYTEAQPVDAKPLTYIESAYPINGRTTAGSLNVREDAGYSCGIMAKLAKNSPVSILAIKEDENGVVWYRVSFEKDGNQETGYVDAQYVIQYVTYVTENRYVPIAIEDVATTIGEVTANKLNVREGAGYEFDISDRLLAGSQIIIQDVVLDTNGEEWYQILYLKDGEKVTAYVKADYVEVEVRFQLFEKPDKSSSYVLLANPEEVLKGVVEAGSDWFYVQTKDAKGGWVLYGMNEEVDAYIRKMLRISEEDWEKVRTEKKANFVSALEEGITYQELFFTDHVKLELKSGEGWLVDFNGDGAKEQLYINENGVYINGSWQNTTKCSTAVVYSYANETWTAMTDEIFTDYWLLDIDTTDGMYELLNGNGDMYIFDGTQLQSVKGIRETFMGDGDDIFRRYLGTLGDFTRIDEHTIAFENCFFLNTTLYATAQYTLDENHNLQIVQQVYDIINPDSMNAVSWSNYRDTGVKSFKLYQSPDFSAEYEEVRALSNISLLKSDCVAWVYIEGENDLSGWLYCGEEADYYFVRKGPGSYVKIPLCLYKEKDENGAYVEVQFEPSMVVSARQDLQEDSWCYVKLSTGEEGWIPYDFKEWICDYWCTHSR